jgi:hypothetical protein
MDAEEIEYDNDCLVITIDMEDCPMAEIPLTEVFDVPTMSLLDNYHDVIRDSVLQQLQDTTWLSEDLLPSLTDPGFGMYHARDRNSTISLRKPALQRLIVQRLKDRSRPSNIVHVPILIRFLIPDVDIPKPPGSSAASGSARESHSQRSRRGPPSEIDTSNPVDAPFVADNVPADAETPVPPIGANVGATTNPVAAAPTFCGQPIDTRPTGGHEPPIGATRRFQTPPENAPPRPLFDSTTTTRSWRLNSHPNPHASFLGRSDFRRRIF